MKKSIQTSLYTGLAALLLTTAGCKKDFNNPNAATSDQVFSSAKGLAGVVVGLQRTYASNVEYWRYCQFYLSPFRIRCSRSIQY